MSESTSRTSRRIAKNPTGLLLDRHDYNALFGWHPGQDRRWKREPYHWVSGKVIRARLVELTMEVLRK